MEDMEKRVLRVEVLLGLREPPKEWLLRDKLEALQVAGYGILDAKRHLISNFGEISTEMQKRISRN